MNAAAELFNTLRSFRAAPPVGQTPEQAFLAYCNNVLGSVEGVSFDLKEKQNRTVPTLDDGDKRNLAKAISGFANGAGGVLVWGLEDQTLNPRPISDITSFVDALLEMSHQVTAPAVPEIDGVYIPSDTVAGGGYGLIHIPESNLPPHRVILNLDKVKDHYYVRSGSSFAIATHSQLEDMFGRRPRPNLVILHKQTQVENLNNEQRIEYSLFLENRGRGIAQYPYLDLRVYHPHALSKFGFDNNGGFGLPVIEMGGPSSNYPPTMFVNSVKIGNQDGKVIHSGMTLGVAKAFAIINPSNRELISDFVLRYSIAADGIPLTTQDLVIPAAELNEISCKCYP